MRMQSIFSIAIMVLMVHPKSLTAKENCLLSKCEKSTVVQTHTTEENILSQPLQSCSKEPLTGFFRDGFCRTGTNDRGVHVICAEVNDQFLSYTKSKGNDLSTPSPQYGFPGLKPGDKWCLCAARWSEANEANAAPPVIIEATSKSALNTVDLAVLTKSANKEGQTNPTFNK